MQTLNNTVYKLLNEKKLNVVYFGGSVTHGQGASDARLVTGTSWAARVSAFLKNEYPDAQINFTNSAIGGTGSYLGLYRCERDVLAYSPDLVFIEFAVNDRYQGFTREQSIYTVESIVRKINKNFPSAEIVMLFTTDWYVFGTQYESLLAHKTVAEHYKIPFADLGAALYTELNGHRGESAADETWREYLTDIVHPTDKGYGVYANAVINLLQNVLPDSASALINYSLPAPINLLTDGQITALYAEDINAGDSWEVGASVEGVKKVMYCKNALFPKFQGATFSLAFSGSAFGMGCTCMPDANVTLTIDGESIKLPEKSPYNEVERFAFINLPAKEEHVVTVEYEGVGTFAIGGIFIG